MCTDENGAPHVLIYVNAQLEALHRSAQRCLAEHYDSRLRSEQNKHFYALAEYSVVKGGSSFHATFDKPVLEFICNHDALLHLTLATSHVRRNGQEIDFPEHIRLSYRVGFVTRAVSGDGLSIDNYGSTVHLVILDLKNAVFQWSQQLEMEFDQDSPEKYLAEYFDLLHDAGNHVLFSLPQFGPGGAPMHADYTLYGLSRPFLRDIYGITAEQINFGIASAWQKSFMLVQDGSLPMTGVSADWRVRSLAQFSTASWGQNTYGHFNMTLLPPDVNILCTKEIIVSFYIKELNFLDSNETLAKQFRGWKVAVIVNVLYETHKDGRAFNLRLDLSHDARYLHSESEYPGLAESNEEDEERLDGLINFFAEQYLHIMVDSHHVMTTPAAPVGGNPSIRPTGHPGKTLYETQMHGFDLVFAVSQDSINSSLATLFTTVHNFREWTHKETLRAEFRPMSLRLLTPNSAIVWVHLQHACVRSESSGSEADNEGYQLCDWGLAFEVDIKICSQMELTGGASERHQKTFAFQVHGDRKDCALQHIYLDLEHARYLHPHSTFGDIVVREESDQNLASHLQTITDCITKHYFPDICKDALHVICSVPVWTSAPTLSASLPSYAFTSVAFHTYSEVEVTRQNWPHTPAGKEPALVVFGMTAFRPMPSPRLDVSTSWIPYSSYGTIAVSHRAFTHERLLSTLSRVNALTTLIPLNSGAGDSLDQAFLNLRLQSWADHEHGKYRPCMFELQPSEEECVRRYLWDYSEEWRYDRRGNSSIPSASYEVSCATQNHIELPTALASEGTFSITIGGKVDLGLTLKTTTAQCAAHASVTWSTCIVIQATAGTGVFKLDTTGSTDPAFAAPVISGDAAHSNAFQKVDLPGLLRNAFAAKTSSQLVGVDALACELHAFEGPWPYLCPTAGPCTLGNPMLNAAGDVLFELRPHPAPSVGGGDPTLAMPNGVIGGTRRLRNARRR